MSDQTINPTLSAGQHKALLSALNAPRGSVTFITGKAGTGKSTVLRELKQGAKCLVCAPTGLAAVNVGGQSIHSLFKIPIGPTIKGKCHALGYDGPRIVERADAIVIDEISMVRVDLLDGINWVLQKTLGSNLPFGGKPIIAFGDMWQLEPVVGGDQEWLSHNYKSPFWFDAKLFKPNQAYLGEEPVQINTIELTEVFRQSDPDFVDALNKIRVGDPSGLEYMNDRCGARWDQENEPVTLTYTNSAAQAINDRRMSEINAEAHTIEADMDEDFGKDLPAPATLKLKVGARVMVTKNIQGDDGGLVANGAVGTLVAFFRMIPVVRLDDGRITQVPQNEWKKIRYTFDKKENKIVESPSAIFRQVPLKPAWAITTHKSQGQTLDSAVLALERKSFSHGQLYVALSRVRSAKGLFLQRKLVPSDIIVNPRVKEFCGVDTFDAGAFGASG